MNHYGESTLSRNCTGRFIFILSRNPDKYSGCWNLTHIKKISTLKEEDVKIFNLRGSKVKFHRTFIVVVVEGGSSLLQTSNTEGINRKYFQIKSYILVQSPDSNKYNVKPKMTEQSMA